MAGTTKVVSLADYKNNLRVHGELSPAEKRQRAHDIIAADLTLTADLRRMLFLHPFPVKQLLPGSLRFRRTDMDVEAFRCDNLKIFASYIDEGIVTPLVNQFTTQKIIALRAHQALILNEPLGHTRQLVEQYVGPVRTAANGGPSRYEMCEPFVDDLYEGLSIAIQHTWDFISQDWENAFNEAPNWRRPGAAILRSRVTPALQNFAGFVFDAMSVDISHCAATINKWPTTGEAVKQREAWFQRVQLNGDETRFSFNEQSSGSPMPAPQ